MANLIAALLARFTALNGMGFSASGALASGPVYDDGTWQYFGEATPGSALNATVWRVSRVHNTTKQEEWADGDGKFDNVFTDVTTVQNLTYS